MMILLNNLLAIFRRELKSYFTSPLAYLIVTIFWFIAGLLFLNVLFGDQGLITQVNQREQMGQKMPPIDMGLKFIQFYFNFLGNLLLFILPVLSMGLYTEERKRGTIELLATSPVTNWIVALGKLLGVLSFVTFMMIPIIGYQIAVFNAADPPVPPGVPLVANGALILLAGSILSLGMFFSSLTENNIFAAIMTFALAFLLWITKQITLQMTDIFRTILGHISLLNNYETLIQGLLETSSLVVFASYILLGIFLTAQSIEALRG